MKKNLKIIEDNKASNGIRFANFIIDRLVVYILFFIFGAFAMILFEFFDVEYFLNIAEQIASLSRLEDLLLTTGVYLLYIFLMEYLTKGRTVGKYITGTKVISTDGSEPTFQDYFIRTISRVVPFDAFSFFGENGWHDSWSSTRVVTARTYSAELNAKSEIDLLGSEKNL